MTGNPAPANAPANPIEAWIRNKIKETGADSADARAKIYLECSGIIDLKLKSIPSVEEYMKHKAAYDEKLNRVKNKIEVENKTLFDRTVEFGKRHMPFAAAVAAAINLIADWAKPIAEFTGLLAVGSLTGLAGAWVIGRLAKKQGPRNACASAVFLFGAVSVVSIGVLGVRNFIPGAQATGVVAQIIPGMEGLQQQVLGLDRRLEGIGKDTAETARNTAKIAETSTRIVEEAAQAAQNTRQIASTTESLKRETSDDPVKELANLGVTPLSYQDAFLQGLLRQDQRLLSLLEKAGFRPDTATYQALLLPPYASALGNPSVKDRLIIDKINFGRSFCEPEKIRITAYEYKNIEDELHRIRNAISYLGIDFVSSICGDFGRTIFNANNIKERLWIEECKILLANIRIVSTEFKCEFKNRNLTIGFLKIPEMIPVRFSAELEELNRYAK